MAKHILTTPIQASDLKELKQGILFNLMVISQHAVMLLIVVSSNMDGSYQ